MAESACTCERTIEGLVEAAIENQVAEMEIKVKGAVEESRQRPEQERETKRSWCEGPERQVQRSVESERRATRRSFAVAEPVTKESSNSRCSEDKSAEAFGTMYK